MPVVPACTTTATLPSATYKAKLLHEPEQAAVADGPQQEKGGQRRAGS